VSMESLPVVPYWHIWINADGVSHQSRCELAEFQKASLQPAAAPRLLFQDLPNDRTMRWIEGQGVSVYRAPSHYANGQTRDRQGRLIACSHRGRCLYRTEYDGHVTTLVDRHAGKRLNSPNDVVVKSDGSIWFTDPLYGISNDYKGGRQASE
jgi:gluconolactonase